VGKLKKSPSNPSIPIVSPFVLLKFKSTQQIQVAWCATDASPAKLSNGPAVALDEQRQDQ